VSRRDVTDHGNSVPAPLAPDLRVGTELAGYRLDELVGRGGMGVVYRAEHLRLGRTAALKLLLPERAEGEGFRERFVREARTAAAIQHPNIVTVYDAGEADDLLYIAMQYVDGTDLAAALEREGVLEPSVALATLEQIAEALDAAHALGVVHRDVKPGNVLMDNGCAYLTDFGLTKAISAASSLTMDGQFVGTIDYMSPEQIAGDDVDGRTDVYALGCVLYQCLTGSVPFERDSQVSVMHAHLQDAPAPLRSRRPDLPEELDVVLAKALAKRRDERYASCTDLIAAARAAIGEAAPSPRPPRETRPSATVLVADPDPSVRAMIRVSLKDAPIRVLEAEGGKSALELARREHPSLVFVDWSLPGVTGPAVCDALRADPRTAGIRIVALSSRAEALDEQAIRDGGADGQLAKPFSSLRLLYAVRDALGQDVLSV